MTLSSECPNPPVSFSFLCPIIYEWTERAKWGETKVSTLLPKLDFPNWWLIFLSSLKRNHFTSNQTVCDGVRSNSSKDSLQDRSSCQGGSHMIRRWRDLISDTLYRTRSSGLMVLLVTPFLPADEKEELHSLMLLISAIRYIPFEKHPTFFVLFQPHFWKDQSDHSAFSGGAKMPQTNCMWCP